MKFNKEFYLMKIFNKDKKYNRTIKLKSYLNNQLKIDNK